MNDIRKLVLDALRGCIIKRAKNDEYARSNIVDAKNDVVATKRHLGALTSDIAEITGFSLTKARYHLSRLEQSGLVMADRHPGWSVSWWPVGIGKEIEKEVETATHPNQLGEISDQHNSDMYWSQCVNHK